jgi:uncharacterized membrane protein YsdA (DUF1294 family)
MKWKDEDKVTMWKTEEECLPVVKHLGGGIGAYNIIDKCFEVKMSKC